LVRASSFSAVAFRFAIPMEKVGCTKSEKERKGMARNV
jgi:hypothetical protein